jgi:hypothetical protein
MNADNFTWWDVALSIGGGAAFAFALAALAQLVGV